MASRLPAGTGRGVTGLKPLRVKNFHVILDRLETLFEGKKPEILEVGCGEGWFLECASRRGMRVEGIEPALEGFDGRLMAELNIRPGRFPDALTGEKSYDAIVFNDVFEHFSNPEDVIRQVEERLNDGGVAVLNLPSSNGFVFSVSRVLRKLGVHAPWERLWQKGMASPHVTYFNPENLRLFVERHTKLRFVFGCRLSALSRHGLWSRVSSTYSKGFSMAIFVIVWPVSFVLDLLPSDARLSIFEKDDPGSIAG